MVNWRKAVLPASPSCWCLIRAPEPAQPSPGALVGHSLPSMSISDTSPISQAGFTPSLLRQDGMEPAWLPPQQQPRDGSTAELCWAWKGLRSALVKEGQRGWAGKHLKAAAGGAGFVQTNLSQEWSAKALLNTWKLRLFTSEVYTLHRFGDFFFSFFQ